jgi:tetratricopeptide (TPR) repeat protein
MKQTLLFLLITQITFCQNNELSKLLEEGGKAFTENNFLLAKEIYTNAAELFPGNKDSWYNLAATELNLGENDNACEHFYKVYLLNDSSVVKNIKEYCPNFRNGTIMSYEDVEEKPKFIFEEKEYLLFENNNLNQVYLNVLIKKMKKSNILSEKLKGKGKVFVQIVITKQGIFNGKIIRTGADEKDAEIVKIEIMSILRNMVTYIPAKNKGENVDIWEKWTLPIDFGR